MLKETNINNADKETRLFSMPKKRDTITSAHIDGNWGDIVTKYRDGKTVNYVEEVDFNEFEKNDIISRKKQAA